MGRLTCTDPCSYTLVNNHEKVDRLERLPRDSRSTELANGICSVNGLADLAYALSCGFLGPLGVLYLLFPND